MRALLLLGVLPACFIDAPTFFDRDGSASGDDVDAMVDPCPNAFTIGGALDGLWDPAELSLALAADGTTDVLAVDENGDFTFAPCLADGTSFTVSVEAQPALHDCTVFGASGMIVAEDVTTVNVKCTGPAEVDVDLNLPIYWAFDSVESVHRRALSLLSQEVRVTVNSPSATSILVGGMASLSGLPSDGIRLAMGLNTIEIVVTASDHTRTFLLEFDRGALAVAQLTALKASGRSSNDFYGESLAASTDLAIVAAPLEDSSTTGINPGFDDNAMNSGAVYSTLRMPTNGESWIGDAYIKASNTEAHDGFGEAIALDGDTLVVGAYFADSTGAVYVFRRLGNVWMEQAIVKPANADAADLFGGAIAISGDYMVVGATGEDSAATGIDGDELDDSAEGVGAAYIFHRDGSTWTQEAYLKPAEVGVFDGATPESFGEKVAIDGDTVVVSAPGDDSSASGIDGDTSDNSMNGAGAVYVFRKTRGVWAQEAYIKASNPTAVDWFGRDAIALQGDVLAVGTAKEDSFETGINGAQVDDSAPDSGAVYIFRRVGTVWQQEAYVKASNTGPGDEFGCGVALWGDVLAVGAGGESSDAVVVDGDQANDNAMWSGAVYLFRRDATSWSQVSYVKPMNTNAGDGFGCPVALSGSTLLGGAVGEDSGSSFPSETLPNSGAAYLFR